MISAAAFPVGLVLGFLIGAVAVWAHDRIQAQIAADTRTAFVDDAAEQAIDDDQKAGIL